VSRFVFFSISPRETERERRNKQKKRGPLSASDYYVLVSLRRSLEDDLFFLFEG